jgi:hypothetical protein
MPVRHNPAHKAGSAAMLNLHYIHGANRLGHVYLTKKARINLQVQHHQNRAKPNTSNPCKRPQSGAYQRPSRTTVLVYIRASRDCVICCASNKLARLFQPSRKDRFPYRVDLVAIGFHSRANFQKAPVLNCMTFEDTAFDTARLECWTKGADNIRLIAFNVDLDESWPT